MWLTIVDLLKAFDWWRHGFAASASRRSLAETTGIVALLHCS